MINTRQLTLSHHAFEKRNTCPCHQEKRDKLVIHDAVAQSDKALTITVEDYLARKESFLVIDVREPHEFELYNIGGINIPLSKLLSGQVKPQYDKEQPLVVVCAKGIRSLKAAHYLKAHGYQRVKSLTGGTTEYQASAGL